MPKPSTTSTAAATDEETPDEDYDVPEATEEVLQLLLAALGDRDTIVRWSAAKGVGRVTGRLPRDLADQVLESLLDLFSRQHSDGAWHGGCLAVAELGRRGLLLPQRLAQVVPVVLRALQYDEVRGSTSVGAHVRDAASYVCWAFARAYDPAVLQAHVGQLAAQLLVTAVYDRESNVRRAAAAAYQENVGRLGTVPHGIAVIGVMDYFSVGNRSHSYLEVAASIAAFPEYHPALLSHLVEVKMCHWDAELRHLAAQSLGRLVAADPAAVCQRLVGNVLPAALSIDLHGRHGAVLCLGQALLSLSRHEPTSCWSRLSTDKLVDIADLPATLEARQHFRGMGGAMLHTAGECGDGFSAERFLTFLLLFFLQLQVCQFVRDLATAGFPVEIGRDNSEGGSRLSQWLTFLRASVEHVEEGLRTMAGDALSAVCQYCLLKDPTRFRAEVLEPLVTALGHAGQHTAPSYRRIGLARALGGTPGLLAATFADTVSA